MRKTLVIGFDGPDGSGKSTQLALLNSYLKSLGYSTYLTREPGGTYIGDRIRDIFLDTACSNMDYRTEYLLMLAQRAQHFNHVINPKVKEHMHDFILMDRGIFSSAVYQGYVKDCSFQDILADHMRLIGCDCLPDITFIVNVDPKTGLGRAEKRGTKDNDRMESKVLEFHEKVAEGFRKLSEGNPFVRGKRIFGVDGSKSITEVSTEIIDIFDKWMTHRL